jgi:hypothetical protein
MIVRKEATIHNKETEITDLIVLNKETEIKIERATDLIMGHVMLDRKMVAHHKEEDQIEATRIEILINKEDLDLTIQTPPIIPTITTIENLTLN